MYAGDGRRLRTTEVSLYDHVMAIVFPPTTAPCSAFSADSALTAQRKCTNA